MATLAIVIEAGPTTCASTPGRFCRFMSWNALSGRARCDIFGELSEAGGWVRRHRDCIRFEASPQEGQDMSGQKSTGQHLTR